MNKNYKIPSSVMEKAGDKLKNGNDFSDSMVGALYGSSLEYNISFSVSKSNGGDVLCPANSSLIKALKPLYQDGEFGAFKGQDGEDIISGTRELGRSVMELATEGEIRSVRKTIDRLMILNDVTQDLVYMGLNGQKYTYQQILDLHAQHKAGNAEIQRKKDQFLADNHCLPRYVDGKMVSPKYSDFVLEGLKNLNRDVWTPTGVQLVITFTGLHTIAKDGGFAISRVDQASLDALASSLRYKENNSFFKGTLKSARISVPIQSLEQYRKITGWLLDKGGLSNADWPQSVRETVVRLDKVGRGNKTS